MNKQKAANLLDKLIQCRYLRDVDKCPNVPCRDCEYSTEHYDTREIIEAMKMALEALEREDDTNEQVDQMQRAKARDR